MKISLCPLCALGVPLCYHQKVSQRALSMHKDHKDNFTQSRKGAKISNYLAFQGNYFNYDTQTFASML